MESSFFREEIRRYSLDSLCREEFFARRNDLVGILELLVGKMAALVGI
ncbi:hypothetical protein [Psychrobacillus sp. FJAT-51614]